jgi:hypothetical protein
MKYDFSIPMPKCMADKVKEIALLCDLTQSKVACSIFAATLRTRRTLREANKPALQSAQ